MKNFQGQVAIITGAGQGIGLEICKQLVSQGARVVLNDIDEEMARKAAASVTADQNLCLPLSGDASDLTFIQHLVAQSVKVYGKLDIVIANAGLTVFGDFFEYKKEDFNKVLNLNL